MQESASYAKLPYWKKIMYVMFFSDMSMEIICIKVANEKKSLKTANFVPLSF